MLIFKTAFILVARIFHWTTFCLSTLYSRPALTTRSNWFGNVWSVFFYRFNRILRARNALLSVLSPEKQSARKIFFFQYRFGLLFDWTTLFGLTVKSSTNPQPMIRFSFKTTVTWTIFSSVFVVFHFFVCRRMRPTKTEIQSGHIWVATISAVLYSESFCSTFFQLKTKFYWDSGICFHILTVTAVANVLIR